MTRAKRFAAVVSTLGLLLAMAALPAMGTTPRSYTNPISKTFAQSFADPAIVKGKDGFWYAYATSDALRAGDEYHLLPMARSNDLVHWKYVGDTFTEGTAPDWMDVPEMWAPDIAFFGGKYHLYYVVTETTVTPDEFDTAIGVAAASTPSGPWIDSGRPLVGPRPDPESPGDYFWTFDPDLFTAPDGTHYLLYGSYYGGIFVTELSGNGMRTVGEPTQVAINDRYEGAYMIRHGGFYYLFASNANCCAGPTTGYSVFVGRSTSPRGPFVDRAGDTMTESRVGGTRVIQPNGNKWVGTGHNSMVTDLTGQDWLVYHAIDRRDPFLEEPFGVNQRPMLMDRLDWIAGWPTVRGGHWASEGRVAAPVTRWAAGSELNGRSPLGAWHADGGRWRARRGVIARGYVRQSASSPRPSFLTSREDAPARMRAEADLRIRSQGGAAGLLAAYRGRDDHVVAWLDRNAGALVSDVRVDGSSAGRVQTPLPDSFRFEQWHNVAMEIRGTGLRAEVTDARLHDPVAVQRRTLPSDAVRGGSVGVAARAARIDADNIGAARLYTPHTSAAPHPSVGGVDPAYSDEFDDGTLDPQWSWVRLPSGRETGGAYRWPTQDADLVGEDNSASVLLRAAPPGRYTAETKLTLPLGVNTDRSFQQAGMVVYVNDDHHVRLTDVAIFNTRQTEFLKEMPYAGGISSGGMAIGPPARVTWLRIEHRRDPMRGEHELRAATSRDGKHWVWGGVWTLPARTQPRLGLVSMGGAGATADFAYFRVHRPAR